MSEKKPKRDITGDYEGDCRDRVSEGEEERHNLQVSIYEIPKSRVAFDVDRLKKGRPLNLLINSKDTEK